MREVDQHEMLQARHLAQDRLQLRPQIHAGKGRQRDQHLRLAGPEQLADGGRLEKRVDGENDAGRLAAPNGQMSLGKVRQHEGDDIVLADAEAVEEVGRGGDAGEEDS